MWNRFLFIFALLVLSSTCLAQRKSNETFKDKLNNFKNAKLYTLVYGPYFGLQKGRTTLIEFGYEWRLKRIKLIRPITYSAQAGFNYGFANNVLGYDLGVWGRSGRVNLTWGLNTVFRTNFTNNKVGIGPTVGYKIGPLHLQTGYNFLTNREIILPTNDFYIRLQFVFIQKRKFSFK